MKKIILIEDNAAVQDAIKIMLNRAGFEVISYDNGIAVLQDETVVPDLYILDKQLPGVDGLDICRHLKEQHTNPSTPVIILSASPHVAALAKAAGADGFLEKPFRNATLVKLANQLISR